MSRDRATGHSLLREVRSRMYLHTPRRVRSVLEGEYPSIHKGRSMDFEDLRDYVPGDDVKDIDWNATARRGAPLLKEHVANKQHAVVLVVDTGRSMAALAECTRTKVDLAVHVAGVIGQLVIRHGDPIALVAGPTSDDRGGRLPMAHLPFGHGAAHLERVLREIDDAPSADGGASDLAGLLAFAASLLRRRVTVAVVADDIALDDRAQRALRRIRVQHDVVFVTIGDAPLGAAHRSARLVETGAALPAYLRRSRRVHAEFAELDERRHRQTVGILNGLGIVGTRITRDTDVAVAVLELLERQRARR